MTILQNIPLDPNSGTSSIFYKNADIPKISLGDKVKIVIYLELPKETAEGEKKKKNVFKVLKVL